MIPIDITPANHKDIFSLSSWRLAFFSCNVCKQIGQVQDCFDGTFIKSFHQGFFWQIFPEFAEYMLPLTHTQARLCFVKGKYLYVVQLNAHQLRVKPLWWGKMLGEVIFPVSPQFKNSLPKWIFWVYKFWYFYQIIRLYKS